MSLRVRTDGRILCAAMHPEEPGDVYVDDGVHYYIAVTVRVLVTEEMFHEGGRGGHKKHGEWWWAGRVPPDVRVDQFYLDKTPS